MIPAIAKKGFPLPPEISKPEIREGRSYDAHLAEKYPDLRCQLEHASPVRRKHDEKARDSVNWLPLSELPERLFSQHTFQTAKNSHGEYQDVLNQYRKLLKDCYENSPTFRRLFNYADKNILCDVENRLTLGPPTRRSEAERFLPFPRLKDSNHTPRTYKTEQGMQDVDAGRAMLDLLLPKITGLKATEPGHPRGAIIEYTNIILKEMGNSFPARIAAHVHHRPATELPSLATLQRLKTQYSASLYEGPESALIRRAVETFKQQASEHLSLLPDISNPTNRDALAERKKAIHSYASTLTSLIRKVKPDDSTLTVLQKIAVRNLADKTFSYAINKSYRPLDMVMHRKGDCVSFCHLYKLLAEACGRNEISIFDIDMPFAFTVDENADIPGIQPGKEMHFARHTILRIANAEGQEDYFDPVVGKAVNPAHYGKSLAEYLL